MDIIQSSTFLIAAMDVVELDKLIAGKSFFLSPHHHDIKQTQSLRLVGFHIKVYAKAQIILVWATTLR